VTIATIVVPPAPSAMVLAAGDETGYRRDRVQLHLEAPAAEVVARHFLF
jgi:hypothetical protein